ncbi:MAG: penicillin-binding protein 2, partial [Pseudomonadota bacterium]
ETVLFQNRVVVAGFVSVCLMLLLLGRMIQLQVFEHIHFRTLSENNRVKIVPVAPTRGLIYDRNGIVLAQNTPTYSLDVIPDSIDDVDTLIEELARLVTITELDIARFKRALNSSHRYDGVPLRLRLSDEEVARFAVVRHEYPGVDVRARLSRDYPLGALAAHVVGYMGRINERDLERIDRTNYRASTHIGKTGVERAYEELLHGGVGYQHVETNAQGRVLRVLLRQDATPGADLHLSIDVALQATAEAALGAENGAVVAVNPRTGGVLAMVSTPSFDPNLFAQGIDPKTFKALNSSPERPLFNRILYGRYPPGSTLKPFVGLAGLEFGAKLGAGKTWCPGFYQLEGHDRKYRDWKRSGHGSVGLKRSIVESCDVYFYELALELGIDRMHDFLGLFGFGAPTGIDLGTESRGLLPSREWKRGKYNKPWYPGETLITGIGQGFTLTTPLQLAAATATLANRGLRLQPQLVERMVDGPAGREQINAPRIVGQIEITQPRHWEDVVEAMKSVVHAPNGTAKLLAEGIDYHIAGKTGTAQVFGIPQDAEYDEANIKKKLRDHALFVSFAPIERPRIAVAVVVENGGSGSAAAAPIAGRVIHRFLRGDPAVGETGTNKVVAAAGVASEHRHGAHGRAPEIPAAHGRQRDFRTVSHRSLARPRQP